MKCSISFPLDLPYSAGIRNATATRFLTIAGLMGAALMGAALLIGMTGCGEDARVASTLPQVWAAGPSKRVLTTDSPRDETSCFSREEKRIHLTGAVNETVAFDFVLSAKEQFASGLVIEAEDLVSPSGTIPRGRLRIYRHWPIAIDRFPNWYYRSIGPRKPREIPDALVPISTPQYGQPFTIAPGESLVLWVEIRIPLDAQVGDYEGAIVVREPDGSNSRTPVSLSVRDIYLSPEDAIPVLARVQIAPIIAAHTSLDPENMRQILSDPEARRILYDTFSLLQEHGFSPLTDAVRPYFSREIDGTITLDWDDYESFCGPLIDGTAYADGRGPARWPLPVDLSQPDPTQFGGLGSTTYTAVLRKTLEAAAAHFEEKNRLDQAYVFLDYPGNDHPRIEELERVRTLAKLTHLAHERLRFVTRLIPHPMSPFGLYDHVHMDLTSVIDIWSTPARYQHQPTLARLQTLGHETWLWPDRPPFSGSIALEASPIQTRSLAWQAFLQGHDAILLDHVTQWPENGFDEPIHDRQQRSDTWLVYPGTLFGLSAPVPSVRLKQLQLGLQDAQKLRLLAKHDRSATARLIAGSLIKAAGTDAYGDHYQDGFFGRRVDDPAIWALAVGIVNDELEHTLRDPSDPGPESGASRADWARFLSATRSIEAWVESSRLRIDDRPNRQGYLMSHDVAIRSDLRTPLNGKLNFGPLPEGARRVSDVVRIGPIPEMGMERKRLVAHFAALPKTDLDGHAMQPIVFDAGTSGRIEMTAAPAIVFAPRAPRPIRVDGHLNDWLPAVSNAAGDFRLITERDGRQRGNRARATYQTIAYFTRRDGILYIGIHAAVSEATKAELETIGPYSNRVDYEDLMPVGGEDLVEILIDPTHAGTQSDDLYHIVVKSTGNPKFERGVEMLPPIGRAGPWPGKMPACSVVATDQGWSAEIAIPLAAFGPEAMENRVWGVNLARFDPVHGEYSDWARAPRHCYDPRTLGNLVWPDED